MILHPHSRLIGILANQFPNELRKIEPGGFRTAPGHGTGSHGNPWDLGKIGEQQHTTPDSIEPLSHNCWLKTMVSKKVLWILE